ncbi:MAG: hypothetical protein J7500_15765 [Sphingomonas sp.]|uniref:hypothetical protein n=1 Tax=Sphingomonas sp. TaxID=28214 RepID=UPI001AFE39B9|nr:hypothetical protein [Sphingomonas sp.]MBO9624165.1 hypothetical protein [Sphingomonas sp.]
MKKMQAYTSTLPVEQPQGVYNKPGEVFYSDTDKPGEGWEKVDPKDAAAIEAATNPVPEDANLEAASKAALEAVAIMRHVNIAGLDKPALITAIKASYEPKL